MDNKKTLDALDRLYELAIIAKSDNFILKELDSLTNDDSRRNLPFIKKMNKKLKIS